MKTAENRSLLIRDLRKYDRLGLSSPTLSPFTAVRRIHGACRNEEEARSLLALYETVRFLHATDRHDVLEAVRYVYRPLLRHAPRSNEISLRALRYADEKHCDVRTVWRLLHAFLALYAKMRAL